MARWLRTTSSLLWPTKNLPESRHATVQSHKLMLREGLIRQLASGVYHLLPLGLRALEKLVALVDHEMQAIGAVKMAMPILTPSPLWETSGRWEAMGAELFRLQDRNGTDYCLGPTHEESVTDLVGRELVSYRQLPLRLYQLDRKFRDEEQPKYGLLRGREFWMKDMYSFDVSEEKAHETYSEVCAAYEKIFQRLNTPVVKVKAPTGVIGGFLSHEYHIPASVGEDTLITCSRCGRGCSAKLLLESPPTVLPDCPTEGQECDLQESRGIEVAHAFFLGTKYSSVFGTSFTDKNGKDKVCQMGCYGVGVSRVLQAVIEYRCSEQTESVVWPPAIAPFFVCVVPLTSSEDPTDPLMQQATDIYHSLEGVCPSDIVLEDRTHLSIGVRLRDLNLRGYPAAVIIGPKTPEGRYELELQAQDGTRSSRALDKDSLMEAVRSLYQ